MKIFLSHSGRDKPLIREICGNLPDHIRTWIDEQAILIGDDIEASIRAAIGAQTDMVVIFIGRDSVSSPWVKKELRWALERERELGRSFVLPVLLDDASWDLIEPVEFRRRKYIECTDYSKAGVEATAERLKEELFAWTSRQLERLGGGSEHSGRDANRPKNDDDEFDSTIEFFFRVLEIYHDMTKKRIRDTLGELFEELEGSTIPADAAGNEYVLKALDRSVQKMDAEHNERSSEADNMRERLASETDEEAILFNSAAGFMIEGASMIAKLTRNHLLTVRRRFEKESRKAPSGEALGLLRNAVDQLEAESEEGESS